MPLVVTVLVTVAVNITVAVTVIAKVAANITVVVDVAVAVRANVNEPLAGFIVNSFGS